MTYFLRDHLRLFYFGNKEKKKRVKLLATIKKLQESQLGDKTKLQRLKIDIEQEVPLSINDKEYLKELLSQLKGNRGGNASQDTPKTKNDVSNDKKQFHPTQNTNDQSNEQDTATHLADGSEDSASAIPTKMDYDQTKEPSILHDEGEMIKIPPQLADITPSSDVTGNTTNVDVNVDNKPSDLNTDYRNDFLTGKTSSENFIEKIRQLDEDTENFSLLLENNSSHNPVTLRQQYETLSHLVNDAKDNARDIINDVTIISNHIEAIAKKLATIESKITSIESNNET